MSFARPDFSQALMRRVYFIWLCRQMARPFLFCGGLGWRLILGAERRLNFFN